MNFQKFPKPYFYIACAVFLIFILHPHKAFASEGGEVSKAHKYLSSLLAPAPDDGVNGFMVLQHESTKALYLFTYPDYSDVSGVEGATYPRVMPTGYVQFNPFSYVAVRIYRYEPTAYFTGGHWLYQGLYRYGYDPVYGKASLFTFFYGTHDILNYSRPEAPTLFLHFSLLTFLCATAFLIMHHYCCLTFPVIVSYGFLLLGYFSILKIYRYIARFI